MSSNRQFRTARDAYIKVSVRRRRSLKYQLPLAIAVLSTVTLILPPAVLAAPEVNEEGRLQQYEKAVTGKVGNKGSINDRLAAIEKVVFGKAKKGSASDRLNAIGKEIGSAGAPPSEAPSCLSGPQAPAADLSHSPTLNSATGGENRDCGMSAATPSSPDSLRVSRHVGRVAVTQEDRVETENLLRQGMQAYSQGRYPDASGFFNQVLERDPRNCHAMYNLAAIDESRGDLDAALQKYELALSFNRSDVELQKAVDSVRQELNERNAQRAREEATRQYQLAEQQAHHGHVNSNGRLSGGVAQNQFQPPVVDVSTPNFHTANAPMHPPPAGPSRAASVARTAASIGLMVGIGMAAGRGVGLGALHCPICRVLNSR